MSRSPRFLPDNKDGVLVEVSSRTVNAWALLRPSAELSDVTVGVLGRSLEISPVPADPPIQARINTGLH